MPADRIIGGNLLRKLDERAALGRGMRKRPDKPLRRGAFYVASAHPPARVEIDVEVDAFDIRFIQPVIAADFIEQLAPFFAHAVHADFGKQCAVGIDKRYDPRTPARYPSSDMVQRKQRRRPFARVHGVLADPNGVFVFPHEKGEQIAPLARQTDHRFFAPVTLVKALDFFIDVHPSFYEACGYL